MSSSGSLPIEELFRSSFVIRRTFELGIHCNDPSLFTLQRVLGTCLSHPVFVWFVIIHFRFRSLCRSTFRPCSHFLFDLSLLILSGYPDNAFGCFVFVSLLSFPVASPSSYLAAALFKLCLPLLSFSLLHTFCPTFPSSCWLCEFVPRVSFPLVCLVSSALTWSHYFFRFLGSTYIANRALIDLFARWTRTLYVLEQPNASDPNKKHTIFFLFLISSVILGHHYFQFPSFFRFFQAQRVTFWCVYQVGRRTRPVSICWNYMRLQWHFDLHFTSASLFAPSSSSFKIFRLPSIAHKKKVAYCHSGGSRRLFVHIGPPNVRIFQSHLQRPPSLVVASKSSLKRCCGRLHALNGLRFAVESSDAFQADRLALLGLFRHKTFTFVRFIVRSLVVRHTKSLRLTPVRFRSKWLQAGRARCFSTCPKWRCSGKRCPSSACPSAIRAFAASNTL